MVPLSFVRFSRNALKPHTDHMRRADNGYGTRRLLLAVIPLSAALRSPFARSASCRISTIGGSL
ncbi:MAG: hypothetical protein IJ157_07870 [Clostridia bacterium]|nr:hypothetical protein [Clostridia bacterium]